MHLHMSLHPISVVAHTYQSNTCLRITITDKVTQELIAGVEVAFSVGMCNPKNNFNQLHGFSKKGSWKK